ncbi:MAG: hypothetical protein ACTS22_05700 [Phycisphaerales bacterium]
MTTTRKLILAAAAAALPGTAAADLESDFGVAWDGTGQLKVEFNFASIEPIAGFVTNGGANGDFTGWFSDEPGFANFEVDEPDEGLFVVPDGTVVGFELLSVQAPFRVYDPFFDAVVPVGGTFELGSVSRDPGTGAVISGFDDHPWWTVDSTDPAYDENVFDYTITFRLFDARTDGVAPLAATDPITVTFTRIPTPGAAAVLGLAGLASLRRRR